MKSRKRISPISKRRAVEQAKYAKAKREWWKTISHKYCPVAFALLGRKMAVEKTPHHLRGRAGSLLCDTRYWMAVSEWGHNWIHSNPAMARAHGWLCAKGLWNTPAK